MRVKAVPSPRGCQRRSPRAPLCPFFRDPLLEKTRSGQSGTEFNFRRAQLNCDRAGIQSELPLGSGVCALQTHAMPVMPVPPQAPPPTGRVAPNDLWTVRAYCGPIFSLMSPSEI
jgi:hypothetical protein